MKKGKTSTILVLALEIVTIAVLHAVKLNHNTSVSGNKEIGKASGTTQFESKLKSSISIASFQ